MGSLLAHYFVGGAAVPQDVGIGILVVVCVFVAGWVFCSHLAALSQRSSTVPAGGTMLHLQEQEQ